MMVSFQDRISPLMEQILFFHDHCIVLIRLIRLFRLYCIFIRSLFSYFSKDKVEVDSLEIV
jgi:hypothetical protein